MTDLSDAIRSSTVQISGKLRKGRSARFWFCPACEEMHPLPFGWVFNDDVNAPTFQPSFKHCWKAVEPNPETPAGRPARCCHYIITRGQVAYCSDCTHALAGQTIPMPDLPEGYRD